MRSIYRDLYCGLKEGNAVGLVTTCGPGGRTKLTKRLGPEAWESGPDDEGPRVRWNGDEVTVEEVFLPRSRMIILGGGHIAVPLSKIASLLEFDVTVFDDRPSFANHERFPEASSVICDAFANVSGALEIRGRDYVVIVTRGHRHDSLCLRDILRGTAPRYISMVASRHRAAVTLRQMEEEGFSSDLTGRLHSPAGLDIGAATPEEIALSIVSEAVLERRRGGTGGASRNSERYADMRLMEWLSGDGYEKIALVTVLLARGSTPRDAGAKMAVLPDGRSVGSIGGGCAEANVIRDAIDVIQNGGYRIRTADMTDPAEDDEMACGGSMEVLIEAL
ncbi:MAG: XdhC family protein [Synergistaceae bacterium]|jgi:xanthine dehydrogenase accessory factor|nr:XdhC family protein [Synergistaceae bacterium]